MTTNAIPLSLGTFTDLGVGPFRLSISPIRTPLRTSATVAFLVEADTQPPGGASDGSSYGMAEGHPLSELKDGVWTGHKRLWARGDGLLLVTPLGEPILARQGVAHATPAMIRDAGLFRSTRVRNTGTAPIFVGGADVATASGWPVAPGTTEDFGDFAGALWVVAAADQAFSVLAY